MWSDPGISPYVALRLGCTPFGTLRAAGTRTWRVTPPQTRTRLARCRRRGFAANPALGGLVRVLLEAISDCCAVASLAASGSGRSPRSSLSASSLRTRRKLPRCRRRSPKLDASGEGFVARVCPAILCGVTAVDVLFDLAKQSPRYRQLWRVCCARLQSPYHIDKQLAGFFIVLGRTIRTPEPLCLEQSVAGIRDRHRRTGLVHSCHHFTLLAAPPLELNALQR